jgi:hypothetical protein
LWRACCLLLVACGGANEPAATVVASAADTMSRAASVDASAKHPDHHEFEADLQVPFVSTVAQRRAASAWR